MKQQFLKAKTGTIRMTVYDSNRPLIPASANVTLYSPSGSELQTQAAASVDATTGEITYSLTAVHTANHDLNYKVVWDYIISGTTYYETQLFDVVKSILSIPITDDDLYLELPSLRKKHTQLQGTATGAAAGTLIDTLKLKDADDFWKGGTIEIISGTGSGQKRSISGFTQSTATLAVTPDWGTNPSTDSIYIVVKSFADTIEQCFDEIENMLYNKGQRHSLILESSQVKFALLYLTLHKICLDMSDEVDDKWDRLSISYIDKHKTAFTTMKVEYDEDESGTIDEDEESRSVNRIRISRG